jgi:copper transport protein
MALPAIAVLVVSGSVQGWRQIHGWDALLHTEYARFVVIKVLVLVGIVIIASAARDALKERLADRQEMSDVRRGVAVELVLAIAVIGVTASLVVTAPAREAVAAARRPTARTLRATADGSRVRYGVIVQPALPGDNTVVVSPALTGDGFLPATLEGRVRAEGSSKVAALTFTPLSDGRWIAVAPLGRAGRWRIELEGSSGGSADPAAVTVTVG